MERQIQSGRHALPSTSLFTDEALIRLLDAHPREDLDIYAMDGEDTRRVWKRGNAGNLDGACLLDMARRHRLWFNVLRVTEHHESFRALVDRAYGDLEAQCPGFRATARNAHVLISHPRARIFYHADVPLNILWHVRGRKRVFVYPPLDDRFISRECRERMCRGEQGEGIPYIPEFEDHARVFDLGPGDVVTWPQNTPHRVVNIEGLNVSLTTEHLTREARRRIVIHLANSVFRRYLPGRFHDTAVEGAGAVVKATALRGLRRLGIVRFGSAERLYSFLLDPTTPDGMAQLSAGGTNERVYETPTFGDAERETLIRALRTDRAEAA